MKLDQINKLGTNYTPQQQTFPSKWD